MSSDDSKKKRQENYEELVGADLSDDDTSQKKYDEINKKRKLQNIIRCKRYRDKKKSVASISKHRTMTTEEEEEKNKRRKEYDKIKSQRYRDKKRANMINLQADQSSKTVVKHVCKSQNFHNSQIAGPSTRKLAYVPPIHTADLPTQNMDNDDDNIHNNTSSQVNYIPQLLEPIITIYVGSKYSKKSTM